MIKAIIEQLKTGSITNVVPRGQNVANPEKPYVVVWQAEPAQQIGSENGLDEYVVNVHFPKGYVNQVDDYILKETYTLLHDKILITRDSRKVKIESTSRIGQLVTTNDDGTISKERVFITPGIYE